MKIRFLIMNAYTMGGTIRTTYNIAEALARRHDVEVVSVYRRRDTSFFPQHDAVHFRALSDEAPEVRTRRDRSRYPHVMARRRIEDALESRPSRLIHEHERRYDNFNLLTDAHLLRFVRGVRDGVLVGTRPGLNLVIARHASPNVVRVGQEHLHLSHHAKPLRRTMRRLYRELDVVSALTERDAQHYRRVLGDHTRVIRVPNAVPDLRGAKAHGDDSRVVIAAGRLTYQKGFDRLIRAFAAVVPRHPDWTLKIFGKGTKREALQGRIDELGMQRNIQLMGHTGELHHQMAASALYVMSSRFEGFPMVLLEAMAVGLPVISFACRNGPEDLIDHDVNGLLVQQGDVDGLAAAIATLIEDPRRRRLFGERARAVAEGYHIDEIARRWEEVFEEELRAKARVRP